MLNIFMKVGFGILIILLIINIFAFVLLGTANEPVTLTGLLQRFEKAPTIKLDLATSVKKFQVEVKKNDIEIVEFLKNIINAIGAVIGLAVWIVTLLINLVIVAGYVLYLLGFQAFSAYV